MFEKGESRKAHNPGDELTGRPDDNSLSSGYEITEAEAEVVDKVRMYWEEARTHQGEARAEMALDEDFYDGLQWSPQDERELKTRGQSALVVNEIKPTIDWLVGTEKRTKTDFKVLPRKNDKESIIAARAKSELLKYVQDTSYGQMENSQAFKDSIVAGIGWVEIGIRGDSSEDPIFMKHEDWRNIWYDYRYSSKSFDDARYVIRAKWTDLDIAKRMFPDHAEALEYAATSHDTAYDDAMEFSQAAPTQLGANTVVRTWSTPGFADDFNLGSNRRKVVRLIECWYKDPAKVEVVRGGYFDGVEVNKVDGEALTDQVLDDVASTYDSIRMAVKYAIFTGNILLDSDDSPYWHNRLPFVPVTCYRRKRDGSHYGAVRNSRGVQEDLNKRRSKALHILSTRGVVAEAAAASPAAWLDIEEEMSRPDYIIKLDGKAGSRFDMSDGNALAQQHVDLMRDDKEAIRSIGGVTNENLGQDSNAISGKAIRAKQNQGSVVTAEMFDNYRFSQQIQGEILLSLIEQFYTEEKVVRVAGSRGRYVHTTLNKRQPDGTRLNDITAAKSDFAIAEQDYRETLRMSMFETMSELLTKLSPDIALNLLDLVLDMSDLPDKADMVERVRALNGQKAPSDVSDLDISDKISETPEEQAEAQAEQAKAQAEAKQQQLAVAMQEAGIRKELADAMLKEARTQTEKAKVRSADTSNKVKDQSHALEMGEKLGMVNTATSEQAQVK